MQSIRLVYITSRWAYSSRNKDISESSFKSCYLDAVISIDCQLDRIQDHLIDKSKGTIVREFLDWVTGGEETHPTCGRRHPMSRSPERNKKGDNKQHLILLPESNVTSHFTVLLSCCPCHDGPHPLVVSQISAFHCQFAFVGVFVTATRKVTSTPAYRPLLRWSD